MNNVPILVAEGWRDYELLDSGGRQKLERWGQYITIRPEPRAMWEKSRPSLWKLADAAFMQDKEEGQWEYRTPPPKEWKISYSENVNFILRPTDFRHVGVFPEQAANWKWIENQLKAIITKKEKELKILNLFAYTGGATMAAAKFPGVQVTHVDASRPAMMWASENCKLSGIHKESVRWIQDDAVKFVNREIRRGVRYDGIIMDPPRFGRGVKGEVWKLLEDLPKLTDACRQIMSPEPCFWLINAYTADMSSVILYNLLSGITETWGGLTEAGELGITETESGRVLPAGIFARWTNNRN